MALGSKPAAAQPFLSQKVTVIDNGMEAKYRTSQKTVGDFIKEQAFVIRKEDKLNVELEDPVTSDMEISIQRKKSILVQDNKQCKSMETYALTVEELLQEQNIVLTDKDWMNVKLSDSLYPYMHIQIKRYREEWKEEFVEIPFTTEVRKSTQLAIGEKKVVQEGKIGHLQKTWKVFYVDDEEQEKIQISETVIEQPIACIIEEGTQLPSSGYQDAKVENGKIILPNGHAISYTKQIDMSATAYTADYVSTGKHPGNPYFGLTCTGTRAKVGTVAVDPKVIPLGTRLYIEGYGFATAEDTGGAVKGNIIDLYMNSSKEVYSFGRQKRKVYILQ